jgi:uncharacterized protein (TIGR00159 family)
VPELLDRLNQVGPLVALLDVLSVAAVFYWLLGVVGGTRAVPVLRGLAVLLVVSVALGTLFQLGGIRLPALDFLIQRAILPGFLVAIPVIFQPELRRALERLGTSTSLQVLLPHHDPEGYEAVAQKIAKAVFDLAARRIGALIVLERDTGLEDIADTGTRLDAAVDTGLLESIFVPGGPLHDGAAVISHGRIVAAGVVLPLSDNLQVVGDRGTRHRAALGITETSDALAIVVSEETGAVSVAQNGRLLGNFSQERLQRLLTATLRVL